MEKKNVFSYLRSIFFLFYLTTDLTSLAKPPPSVLKFVGRKQQGIKAASLMKPIN